MSTPRGRAAPLPPDERRRVILAAVQPVILEHGLDVTTRQLADAAGVAEGTLFRVFDDKETIVREAAFAAADPATAVEDLARIDVEAPLEERLVRVVEVMGERVEHVRVWMTLLHRVARLHDGPPGPGHGPGAAWAERQRAGVAAVHAQVRRLLAPDADRLRLPLDSAVDAVDALVLGTLLQSGRLGPPGQEAHVRVVDVRGIVGVLLHGVLTPTYPAPPATPGPRPAASEGV